MLPYIHSILKQIIKVDAVQVDSYVSKLHYGTTTVLLVAFSMLLTSSAKISCQSSYSGSHMPTEQQLNTFCFVASYTYSQETSNTYSEEPSHTYIQ